MNYLGSALGADEWKNVSGVCRPMNNASLGLFKELQSQLNRVAVAHNPKWSRIDVDGRLGARTIELYNKAAGESVFLGPVTSCDELSQLVLSGMAVSGVKRLADQLGAPTTVPAPWTSRPTQPNPSGGVPVEPPAAGVTDMVSGLVGSPLGLIALAGAGFVGYRLLKSGKKGGSKRRRPGRAAARRRLRRIRRRRR